MKPYEKIPCDSVIFDVIRIAKDCGKIMLGADRSAANVDIKTGQRDFVTAYDKMIEEKLKRELPELIEGAKFMGEEGDTANDIANGYTFIVDPIDGTTNFIKDYHWSCVSIALLKDGDQFIGVIYNPYTDEVFASQRGCGAYCNGSPIHTTSNDLAQSVIVFGTSPYYQHLHRKTFDIAFDLFERALDVRRSGSAALDLCAIAAGRADVFFEMILSPWDYAAGSLLIEEAGGVISQHDGQRVTFDRACSIFASNGKISADVLNN